MSACTLWIISLAVVTGAPATNPPPDSGLTRGDSRAVDYDIVYVRAPRHGDLKNTQWPEVKDPINAEPGTDLMLLHPDGTEEVLVPGGNGAVVDPFVSFDGQWVYFARFHDQRREVTQHQWRGASPAGADIYKIHLPTRRVVRLTHQEWTPNAGRPSSPAGGRPASPADGRPSSRRYGIFNLGPCPVPGGRIIFTSSRNGYLPTKGFTYPNLQLFKMDEDGANVEEVGYLNLGSALHPTVLSDGRVMFSSYETQGRRDVKLWGLWAIWPDGRRWEPLLSAFLYPTTFHFQTEMSDGSVVVAAYYNQNNNGFGTLLKFPAAAPSTGAPFGQPDPHDPSNPRLTAGQFANGKPMYARIPFSPRTLDVVTPFAHANDNASSKDEQGRWMGKVTQPSGAPGNSLLLVWTPGPANNLSQSTPPLYYDGGIYLIPGGRVAQHPDDMIEIRNDPRYNETQPRAVVPYRAIYGIDEPEEKPWLPNDGSLSPHLPAGTPFGLIGTSSFYKRASAPGVGDQHYGGLDPFNTTQNGASSNWFAQGADAGRYANDEIHAVRILAMEPNSLRDDGNGSGQAYHSHANERLRILGEIPLRKVADGREPLDPDGNPDTSFLALIPADVAFTFQTLDRDGMVLNMSQTWHQLRPGEVRYDCGGCHAHNQEGTSFLETAAARPEYVPFDLVRRTPLLTTHDHDESRRAWDTDNQTGLRYEARVKDVEYFRDIRPIFERSCVACHTRASRKPAGELVLDDNSPIEGVPGTYYRLAMDAKAQFGYRPLIGNWRQTNASRYVRMFQSRRSLLIWKVYGRRTDGWTNDDFPTETVPGDPSTLHWKGEPLPDTRENRNLADLDYNGRPMPPPEAVKGSSIGPNGKPIRVAPLSDEDRMTLVRWIDLGCPIDLERYKPSASPGTGWLADQQRPTLAVTEPRAGHNESLSRILLGIHDYGSGLDPRSVHVVADFPIDGTAAGENLAMRFHATTQNVWELSLATPITHLERGRLTVSVRDRKGNTSRVVRTFSVASESIASNGSGRR